MNDREYDNWLQSSSAYESFSDCEYNDEDETEQDQAERKADLEYDRRNEE